MRILIIFSLGADFNHFCARVQVISIIIFCVGRVLMILIPGSYSVHFGLDVINLVSGCGFYQSWAKIGILSNWVWVRSLSNLGSALDFTYFEFGPKLWDRIRILSAHILHPSGAGFYHWRPLPDFFVSLDPDFINLVRLQTRIRIQPMLHNWKHRTYP